MTIEYIVNYTTLASNDAELGSKLRHDNMWFLSENLNNYHAYDYILVAESIDHNLLSIILGSCVIVGIP